MLSILITVVLGLDNGLGKTPPMGWNSWNKFGCNINETVIKQTVDQLIRTGLR
jgi:alpha-galactosidase